MDLNHLVVRQKDNFARFQPLCIPGYIKFVEEMGGNHLTPYPPEDLKHFQFATFFELVAFFT